MLMRQVAEGETGPTPFGNMGWMEFATHEAGPWRQDGERKVYMAKEITGAKDGESVVYLNGDPLDNRRENLRVVETSKLPPAGNM